MSTIAQGTGCLIVQPTFVLASACKVVPACQTSAGQRTVACAIAEGVVVRTGRAASVVSVQRPLPRCHCSKRRCQTREEVARSRARCPLHWPLLFRLGSCHGAFASLGASGRFQFTVRLLYSLSLASVWRVLYSAVLYVAGSPSDVQSPFPCVMSDVFLGTVHAVGRRLTQRMEAYVLQS